jgi:RNA polymerase sigma factor (sigma-70 family)
VTTDRRIEDVVRELAPQVLGLLVRRYGMFDLCEDAVQEALLAAVRQWPTDGLPEHPRAWLHTAAQRRLTDHVRGDSARRRREEADFVTQAPDARYSPAADETTPGDDSLILLFLCCHPILTEPSQVALTLRSVGGLTTDEIASAYLVPSATMGQRISRAKKQLAQAGTSFTMPSSDELPARLDAVLRVLYLIFNEGYTVSSGPALSRPDLTTEAIRLTRALHRTLPSDGEVAGLLALMLLTEARHAARTGPDGALIPLADQDRTTWDRTLIDEGVALVSAALRGTPLGPYQLQAAIAAIHDEADDDASTDWPQILGLYDLLERIAPNPVVTLNRAVALAMVSGPSVALALLDDLASDLRLARHHRLPAVRGHLLAMAGQADTARDCFLAAARGTTSLPEKRYLEAKARALTSSCPHPQANYPQPSQIRSIPAP